MKLPDFASDAALNELRRAMGAERREFVPAASPEILTKEEIEVLAAQGKEVPLDEVRVLEDGTLAYKNRRVVVYIRDVKQYRNAKPGEEDLPRFHVAHCDKLQEMRANNRYQRYVVATRDTGFFQINLKRLNSDRHETSDQRLRICQFCLGRLDWENFIRHRHSKHRRAQIVSAFTLQSYFSKYGKTFVEEFPNHTEATAPLNEYTKDFQNIAESIKRKRNFRCDKCGIDLSKYRRFLHAHHINGQQNENQEGNIATLCIRHHAEEWGHSQVRQLPEYDEFMRLLKSGAIRS